ncbi:hypothetical protein PG993_009067 [Apiospora rasikravindrae]|uniref:Nephrocystin 3-like N-terminal domain-containing protein n=1 Tax=Apiospora rasikravindrae TaxID=990691 RepID=A0ABR1SIT5_9PEZI
MAEQASSSLVPTMGYDEVMEFMRTRHGESHETLVFRDQAQGSDLDYEGIYAEYREVQTLFFQTANKSLEKFKLSHIEFSDANGWDGIQASMDAACAALDKVSSRDKELKGVTGKVKKAFRSLCNRAGAGKAFTPLIPNDMFGSVIGGGLNVILTCLEQAGVHRENVYKALEKLPGVIEDSLGWTNLASQDASVHKRMAKLYTQICLTLHHILHWFVQNSLGKQRRDIFETDQPRLNPILLWLMNVYVFPVAGARHALNPSAKNANLQDRLAEVTIAAKNLKSRATQVMWSQMKDMRDTQELAYVQNTKTHNQLDELAADVKDIKRLAARYATYDTIDKMVQGNLELLLQDDMKRLFLENTQRPSSSSPSITAKDILEEFQYDQALIPQDIKVLLRMSLPSNTVSSIDMNRVHAIQRNPRLHVWLSDDAPYLYLLNGGAQVAADVSTSFVMAKIASTLLQQLQQRRSSASAMEVIVLAYFCGQHQNYYRDTAASPSELVMSLLLQLIDKYSGYSSTTLQDCLDRTDPQDISSICDSLRCLFEELPSDAVIYLVIDGIAHFTSPRERMEGMQEVIELLVETFRGKVSATLKFIFSSPTRSSFLEDLFEEDEILNIPRDPPPASGPL